MVINLHIERLVLDGIEISSGGQELLRESVARELSRMLGDGGLAQGYAEAIAVPRISAGGLRVEREKPIELGRAIAKSVYGGIGHG